jgi:hypothetical protein
MDGLIDEREPVSILPPIFLSLMKENERACRSPSSIIHPPFLSFFLGSPLLIKKGKKMERRNNPF